MKFSAAAVLAAAAAGVSAHKYDNSTAVVTEVVTAYTTYCPAATEITHGSKTYTVTEATTLTITDCPCTITHSAEPSAAPTTVPVVGGGSFTNSTSAAVPAGPVGTGSGAVGTGSGSVPTAPSAPIPVPTAGAGKTAVLSGAGLAGLVALAAFVL